MASSLKGILGIIVSKDAENSESWAFGNHVILTWVMDKEQISWDARVESCFFHTSIVTPLNHSFTYDSKTNSSGQGLSFAIFVLQIERLRYWKPLLERRYIFARVIICAQGLCCVKNPKSPLIDSTWSRLYFQPVGPSKLFALSSSLLISLTS